MDKLVEKFAENLAGATSRRGFLRSLIRGGLGFSFTTLAMLTGTRLAFANNCIWSSGACGLTICSSSLADANGCYGFPYCSSLGLTCGDPCPPGYSTNLQSNCWFCCCSNVGGGFHTTRCCDCFKSGAPTCICETTVFQGCLQAPSP